MRLLAFQPDGDLILREFTDTDVPPYAILSHTWLQNNDEEVSFQDVEAGTGKNKAGWKKITFCADKAVDDGLQYFWVDTCCIDKANSTELSEALNSMFRWYRDSQQCYVYLSDVSIDDADDPLQRTWEQAFRQSRWFTRGWTLQELIAPVSVKFFSQEGKSLGDKMALKQEIHDTTEIPVNVLSGCPLTRFPIDERLRWAEKRNTKRIEDRAYCLLGIVGIFMPFLYGEGDHAFIRLKEEIDRRSGTSTTNTNTSSNAVLGTSYQQTPARDVMKFEGFLRSLSYPEMEYRYYNVDDVQDDTCRWLLNHSCYQKWRSGTGSSSLLMIRGKPGSGKSTAMKRACRLARERAHANEAIIAFFFNSRGAPMETKLEGFFRSMLHQLLEAHGSTDNEAFIEWKRKQSSIKLGWKWTIKELQNMFEECVIRSTVRITMFVDAMDECESTSAARDLMDFLTKLGSCHDSDQLRPKICVSSRHYPNVGIAEPLQIIVERTNRVDITQYIEMNLQRLQINFSDDLSGPIISRSEGIFLWAHLVLEKIRAAVEDGEPLSTLYTIIDRAPQRLEEVFQELIESVPDDERELRNLIIGWIAFSLRPLSLSELSQALAFRIKYTTYSHYARSNDFIGPEQMRRLLAKYTRGLVEVVESQGSNFGTAESVPIFRVQFIHESVREYIFSQPDVATSGLDANWVNPGFLGNTLALSCFNYIKAVCVEEDVVNDIIRQLESRSSKSGEICSDHTYDRSFLGYAIGFGFWHAYLAETNGFPQLYLFESTTNDTTDNMSWWNPFTTIFRLCRKHAHYYGGSKPDQKVWSEYTTTQLAFACAFNLHSWAHYLLEGNKPTSSEVDLSKALCVAAVSGDEKSITSLIGAGANVNYEEPKFGSPLYISSVLGRDDMVAVLIGAGATVHMGQREHSPLVTATLYCSLDTVRLLLTHGAIVAECESIDMSSMDAMTSLGMHALEAATRRDPEIMEALLAAAEYQQVHAEYYKAAFLSANRLRNFQHAEKLK